MPVTSRRIGRLVFFPVLRLREPERVPLDRELLARLPPDRELPLLALPLRLPDVDFFCVDAIIFPPICSKPPAPAGS